ncbi:hypothetical protein NKG94_43415 [Micromonospora sp. M12]
MPQDVAAETGLSGRGHPDLSGVAAGVESSGAGDHSELSGVESSGLAAHSEPSGVAARVESSGLVVHPEPSAGVAAHVPGVVEREPVGPPVSAGPGLLRRPSPPAQNAPDWHKADTPDLFRAALAKINSVSRMSGCPEAGMPRYQ